MGCIVLRVCSRGVTQLVCFGLARSGVSGVLLSKRGFRSPAGGVLFLLSSVVNGPMTLCCDGLAYYTSAARSLSSFMFRGGIRGCGPSVIAEFRCGGREGRRARCVAGVRILNQMRICLMIARIGVPLAVLSCVTLRGTIFALRCDFVRACTQGRVRGGCRQSVRCDLLGNLLANSRLDGTTEVLGLRSASRCYIMDFRAVSDGDRSCCAGRRLRRVKIVRNRVRELLPSRRVCQGLGRVIYVRRVGPKRARTKFQRRVRGLCRAMRGRVFREGGAASFRVNVKDVIGKCKSLGGSFGSSGGVVSCVSVLECLCNSGGVSMTSFSGLNFFRVFRGVRGHSRLVRCIPRSLIGLC